MPQNEHIERHRKLWGKQYDADERKRKKEARATKKNSVYAKKVRGLKAKLHHTQAVLCGNGHPRFLWGDLVLVEGFAT